MSSEVKPEEHENCSHSHSHEDDAHNHHDEEIKEEETKPKQEDVDDSHEHLKKVVIDHQEHEEPTPIHTHVSEPHLVEADGT